MAGTDPTARPDVAVQVMPAQQNGHRRHAELRGVLGLFATGVGILTAISDGPCGMTANAFTSVSLEPPLVLVCVKQDAEIHRAIVESQSFVISVLGAHQEQIARYFADHGRPRGKDEFAVLRWVHDGGDHSIFLGSVLNIGRSGGRDALLFFGGGFHRLEHRQA